jgi:hypothetical protein
VSGEAGVSGVEGERAWPGAAERRGARGFCGARGVAVVWEREEDALGVEGAESVASRSMRSAGFVCLVGLELSWGQMVANMLVAMDMAGAAFICGDLGRLGKIWEDLRRLAFEQATCEASFFFYFWCEVAFCVYVLL